MEIPRRAAMRAAIFCGCAGAAGSELPAEGMLIVRGAAADGADGAILDVPPQAAINAESSLLESPSLSNGYRLSAIGANCSCNTLFNSFLSIVLFHYDLAGFG